MLIGCYMLVKIKIPKNICKYNKENIKEFLLNKTSK